MITYQQDAWTSVSGNLKERFIMVSLRFLLSLALISGTIAPLQALRITVEPINCSLEDTRDYYVRAIFDMYGHRAADQLLYNPAASMWGKSASPETFTTSPFIDEYELKGLILVSLPKDAILETRFTEHQTITDIPQGKEHYRVQIDCKNEKMTLS
jgi:hypothetical protein